VCTNRRTIKRTDLEAEVLDALRTCLMAPEIYGSFVAGFTAEWNKEQASRAAEGDKARDELKRVTQKIGNLVTAIGDSGGSSAILAALKEAEARKAVLEDDLGHGGSPCPAADAESGRSLSGQGVGAAGGARG
jgi:hypothetical protein